MSKNRPCFVAAVISLFSFASLAAAQVNNPNPQYPKAAHVKQEPCWQQVGISKEVIDQRDAIQQDTHSEIQSVCADSSLTPQQKNQKIREIHQEAKQKMSGLISAEQQQQLEACRKERAGNYPASAGAKHAGTGPCGDSQAPKAGTQTTGSGTENR